MPEIRQSKLTSQASSKLFSPSVNKRNRYGLEDDEIKKNKQMDAAIKKLKKLQ